MLTKWPGQVLALVYPGRPLEVLGPPTLTTLACRPSDAGAPEFVAPPAVAVVLELVAIPGGPCWQATTPESRPSKCVRLFDFSCNGNGNGNLYVRIGRLGKSFKRGADIL